MNLSVKMFLRNLDPSITSSQSIHRFTLRVTLFPDCLIWQLLSELESLISAALPGEDVSVEKFLEGWPQIAKCFINDKIDQGTCKIMLGL